MKSLTLTPKPLVQRPSFKDIYPGQYWILEKKATKERNLVYCSDVTEHSGIRWFLQFDSWGMCPLDESIFNVINQVNLYGVT